MDSNLMKLILFTLGGGGLGFIVAGLINKSWLEYEKEALEKYRDKASEVMDGVTDVYTACYYYLTSQVWGQWYSYKWLKQKFLYSFICVMVLFYMHNRGGNTALFFEMLLEKKISVVFVLHFAICCALNTRVTRCYYWGWGTFFSIVGHILCGGLLYSILNILNSDTNSGFLQVFSTSYISFLKTIFTMNTHSFKSFEFWVALSSLIFGFFTLLYFILTLLVRFFNYMHSNYLDKLIESKKSIFRYIASAIGAIIAFIIQ